MKTYKSFGKLLTTQQLADEVGVKRSTILYYLDQGLLEPDEISDGGFRLFKKKEAVARVRKIKKLQNSIEDIKKELK